MSEKPKLQKLISPIGEAMWAHVHTPKKPFEDKGEPKFQIDVLFDPKDPAWEPLVTDIRKQLVDLPDQWDKKKDPPVKMMKQSPIKRELNEQDQPTGKLVATFRTSAKFKPGVFDKYKRPVPPETMIGNGSKVRVAYSPNTYEGFGGGINFYLNAVQVMELVEYQNKSADSYGFDGEAPPDENDAQPSGNDNIPF